MKRTVEVQVDGQSYRIRSDADEEHLQAVAALLNERLENVRGAMGAVTGTPYRVAFLAALNLADELVRERNMRKEQTQLIEVQARGLLTYLDEQTVQVSASGEVVARA